MPALSDYTAGTITLTNGSINFTGSGTGWQAADFREGDTILGIEDNAGVEYVIATITGNGAGTLTQEWGGATGTYQYRMRYMADGARVTAQARNLIELLGNGNLQALAGLTGPGVPVFNGPHAMEIKPVTDFVTGVTPFWQGRITVDADAAAARVGLEAVSYAGQTLSLAQQGQARVNIGAKPSYNHIDNPEFNFWQRGDAFNYGGSNYTADGWISSTSGGDTVQVLKITPALTDINQGNTETLNLFYANFSGTAAEKTIMHRKRGVGKFAGKRVTLAFWVLQTHGNISLDPIILRNYDSGDIPNSGVNCGAQAIPNSQWTLYKQAFDMPPVPEGTVGPGNTLEIYVFRGVTTAGSVYLGRVGMFEGDWTASADPFPPYDEAADLARCLRRFYRPKPGGGSVMFAGTAAEAVQPVDYRFDFPIPMDVAPTITQEGTWTEQNVTSYIFSADVTPTGFRGVLTATAPGRTFIYNSSAGNTFNASAEP